MVLQWNLVLPKLERSILGCCNAAWSLPATLPIQLLHSIDRLQIAFLVVVVVVVAINSVAQIQERNKTPDSNCLADIPSINDVENRDIAYWPARQQQHSRPSENTHYSNIRQPIFCCVIFVLPQIDRTNKCSNCTPFCICREKEIELERLTTTSQTACDQVLNSRILELAPLLSVVWAVREGGVGRIDKIASSI